MVVASPSLRSFPEAENDFDHPLVLKFFTEEDVAAEGTKPAELTRAIPTSPACLVQSVIFVALRFQTNRIGTATFHLWHIVPGFPHSAGVGSVCGQ